MKFELNEPAYNLDADIDHFEEYKLDWKSDLIFEKWEGFFDYEYDDGELFPHPNTVIFQGDLNIIKHIDYPKTDNYWQVMSKRMYETLLSVGNFPHRTIPVAIVDWTVQPWDWFEETTITRDNAFAEGRPSRYKTGKNLKKEICLWNYLAIQITERLDILDRENCVFNKYITKEELRSDNTELEKEYQLSELEMENRHIDEYAFKIPENGLPPIFKVQESPTRTFVSAEAREAMKKAKITGVQYTSLKGHSGGELRAWFAGDEYEGGEIRTWIDTKIVLPDEETQ